jgi:putative transposase
VARWRDLGDVSPGSSRGRIRSPLHAHRQWLLDRVATTPGLTLAELREQLASERALTAGLAAIWSFFKREGISFKKNAAALRADQARRRAAAGKLAALSAPDRS